MIVHLWVFFLSSPEQSFENKVKIFYDHQMLLAMHCHGDEAHRVEMYNRKFGFKSRRGGHLTAIKVFETDSSCAHKTRSVQWFLLILR